MDWKKIRQAVRTVLAAVLICAASVGITGDPAYAADMGAVYGIYEHGTGWSGYHGDSKTAHAGTGSYVTAIRASLLGQPEGMSGTLSYQVSLTLFAFSKGEEISTHDSIGDAMVHVIDGIGQFTVDGAEHICKAGDVLVMPAKKPHAVFAKEDFKMLLTVVFPLD